MNCRAVRRRRAVGHRLAASRRGCAWSHRDAVPTSAVSVPMDAVTSRCPVGALVHPVASGFDVHRSDVRVARGRIDPGPVHPGIAAVVPVPVARLPHRAFEGQRRLRLLSGRRWRLRDLAGLRYGFNHQDRRRCAAGRQPRTAESKRCYHHRCSGHGSPAWGLPQTNAMLRPSASGPACILLKYDSYFIGPACQRGAPAAPLIELSCQSPLGSPRGLPTVPSVAGITRDNLRTVLRPYQGNLIIWRPLDTPRRGRQCDPHGTSL
jgi:hypothetical protein